MFIKRYNIQYLSFFSINEFESGSISPAPIHSLIFPAKKKGWDCRLGKTQIQDCPFNVTKLGFMMYSACVSQTWSKRLQYDKLKQPTMYTL